jgi:hypothetical protein
LSGEGICNLLTTFIVEGRCNMDLTSVLINAIGGAIGGAGGGKAVKQSDLGPIGNILAGLAGGAGGALATGGGGILGSLLGAAGEAAAGGIDIAAMAGQLVGGGITGLIVQVIVGLVLNKLRK